MSAWTDTPVTSNILIKNYCPDTEKPVLYLSPLNHYLLMAAPSRDHQVPELFHTTELPGVLSRPKQYPLKTGGVIT